MALVAFRLFPRPLWFHATECCGASVCRFKSVPTWLGDCTDRLAHVRDASLQPEYSCCYRVRYRCSAVKSEIEAIFSCLNILRYNDRTLLSSMRSVYDVLPLCRCDMVCGCAIRGTPRRTMWFDFNYGRPTWYIKIFFTFDFHMLH